MLSPSPRRCHDARRCKSGIRFRFFMNHSRADICKQNNGSQYADYECAAHMFHIREGMRRYNLKNGSPAKTTSMNPHRMTTFRSRLHLIWIDDHNPIHHSSLTTRPSVISANIGSLMENTGLHLPSNSARCSSDRRSSAASAFKTYPFHRVSINTGLLRRK